MRSHKIVAGALGAMLGFTGMGQAQQASQPFPSAPKQGAPSQSLPAETAASPNQRMANAIAGYLEASGRFKGQSIEVAFVNGLADLSGSVSDPFLRAEAIRITRTIPGVVGVRDRMTLPGMVPQPMPHAMPHTVPHAMPPGVMSAQAIEPGAGPELPPTGLPEPLSIMPAPTMPNPMLQPPPMPPYAWPSYAPYNNVSRVAYPNLYPYEAWPFIGPMYPFPKVPLGWRAVSLRWQDGHWWYGREATGHDWWRIRYW